MLGLVLLGGASAASAATPPGEVQARIIGGTLAPAADQPGGWPYQTALLRADLGNPQFCGGTLIKPSWVLTAAHCVDNPPGAPLVPSQINLSIGINDLTTVTPAQRSAVSQIYIKPDWNPDTDQNDFALLQLASPSSQPPATLIAAGQAAATVPPNDGEIAGWGKTADNPTNPGSPVLFNATVPFVSDASCADASSYGSDFDAATMLCAGSATKDTCQGDSGGPLMAKVAGARVLAGVTSFGAGCALAAYPGVYAKVSAALAWIAEISGPFALSVGKFGDGGGEVTSSPAGISCGSDCTESYESGATVTLSAAPASGSQFIGWSGSECPGTGACVVVLSAARDVTATFALIPDNKFVLSAAKTSVAGNSISISARASVLGAGLLSQRWSARRRDGRGPTYRCSAGRRVNAAGLYSLRCKFGATARRALRKSSLRLTLITSFDPASQFPTTTQTKTLLLARR